MISGAYAVAEAMLLRTLAAMAAEMHCVARFAQQRISSMAIHAFVGGPGLVGSMIHNIHDRRNEIFNQPREI